MKILFVNPHLKMGGIANSLYNLLTELQKNEKYSLELVCFNPYFDEKFSSLNTSVKIHSPFILRCLYINLKEAKKHLPFYLLIAYAVIKPVAKIFGDKASRKFAMRYLYANWNKKTKYDAAISFSNDLPITNAEMGTNDFVSISINADQKIAWIHNDLDKLGITREYLLNRYKDFDKIVSVSKSCKQDFDVLAPEYSEKSFLVHNFIDSKIIKEKARVFSPYKKENKNFIFVTVARIDNTQKRIDRILKVAQQLIKKDYNFEWHIIGGGPDLESLKAEAESMNLKNHLFFEGFQQNPYPYIKNANCFVLSSAYEAQGMVLSESLILGTPVITTDFPAAKEFVKDGLNGVIVNNSTKGLLDGVETFLKQPEMVSALRKKMNAMGSSTENDSLKEFANMLTT